MTYSKDSLDIYSYRSWSKFYNKLCLQKIKPASAVCNFLSGTSEYACLILGREKMVLNNFKMDGNRVSIAVNFETIQGHFGQYKTIVTDSEIPLLSGFNVPKLLINTDSNSLIFLNPNYDRNYSHT